MAVLHQQQPRQARPSNTSQCILVLEVDMTSKVRFREHTDSTFQTTFPVTITHFERRERGSLFSVDEHYWGEVSSVSLSKRLKKLPENDKTIGRPEHCRGPWRETAEASHHKLSPDNAVQVETAVNRGLGGFSAVVLRGWAGSRYS